MDVVSSNKNSNNWCKIVIQTHGCRKLCKLDKTQLIGVDNDMDTLVFLDEVGFE